MLGFVVNKIKNLKKKQLKEAFLASGNRHHIFRFRYRFQYPKKFRFSIPILINRSDMSIGIKNSCYIGRRVPSYLNDYYNDRF